MHLPYLCAEPKVQAENPRQMPDAERQRETPTGQASLPKPDDGRSPLEFLFASRQRYRSRDLVQGWHDVGPGNRRKSDLSGQRPRGSIDEISPWLDNRLFPLELVLTALEHQTHRRSIKTHLPLDTLPFDRRIKIPVRRTRSA
jgi:hypothetical protein